MKRPFQVMVLGTGSHVGKSLVAAGLCRLLSDRGFKVAPFKAQNMALNSVVATDGAEIGQAQALQALAARVPAVAAMNPVLLKPVRGQGSQVILLGQAQGFMTTAQYFKFWPKAAKTAEAAWKSLAATHQALVIEGAGSPAEVNLAHRDLANLATGRFSRAPWILVVDIERGGSFAAIVGTLVLIPAWLRARCLGVLINKFRGDARLMEPGLAWLKARGIRPLGVLPYLDGLALEQEDSLGVPSRAAKAPGKKALQIQVIQHPFIANFNDCLPLAQVPGLHLDWVKPGQKRPRPDLVILPGSKDSLADLETLWTTGEAAQLKQWVAQGTWVLGICGGLQMLGSEVVDPAGHDSGRRRDILRELLQALTRSGPYRHGIEELTPVRWPGTGVDPVTAIPAVAATLATLIRPAAWRHFAAGATSAYSLSPASWQALLEAAQQPEFTQAGCASPADLPAGGAVHMGGDVALVPVARGQRP